MLQIRHQTVGRRALNLRRRSWADEPREFDGDIQAGEADGAVHDVPRTDQDLSLKFVGIGILVLLTAIMLAQDALHMNFLGALLIVGFGFLFVTVSSRLTGEVGVSGGD